MHDREYQVTVRTQDDVNKLIRLLNSIEINWTPDYTEEGTDPTGTYYEMNFFAPGLTDDQKQEIASQSYVITSYLEKPEERGVMRKHCISIKAHADYTPLLSIIVEEDETVDPRELTNPIEGTHGEEPYQVLTLFTHKEISKETELAILRDPDVIVTTFNIEES